MTGFRTIWLGVVGAANESSAFDGPDAVAGADPAGHIAAIEERLGMAGRPQFL